MLTMSMFANKEDMFREMCSRHDLTYQYSDDGACYRSGRDSEAKIKEFAKQLEPEVAKRIWDEVVDTKIVEGSREPFYW